MSIEIEYQYNELHWSRSHNHPVSKEEFGLLKMGMEAIMNHVISERDDRSARAINPHRFKWKKFLVLLGLGCLFGLLSYLCFINDMEELGGYLFIPNYFILFIIVVVWPIRYFMSSLSSSGSHYEYEQKAQAYFKVHHTLVAVSRTYEEYLKKVSGLSPNGLERE